MHQPQKTSIGLDENVAGALAYALGWITGIAFLLAEPENRFVRFHAAQSAVVFGALSALWFVGWSISLPRLGRVRVSRHATLSVSVAAADVQGLPTGTLQLPIAGDIAEQQTA
jgi:uncharacterized membrane protein